MPELSFHLLVALVLCIMFGIAFGYIASAIVNESIAHFDSAVIGFVQGLEAPWLTSIMKVFTWIGSGYVVTAIALVGFIVLYFLLRYRHQAFLLLTVVTGSILLNKALKSYSDAIMGNAIRWCVIAYPSYNWAKLMFPESDDPEAELFEAIKHTVRLDSDDPVAAWNDHIETLNRHAKIMNDYDFSYLRYETSAGTNLKVGLAKDAVWLPAQEKAKDGVPFIANMPTEEVFTAPDNTRIDGVVKNALPLSYNGTIIDGFSVTFKDGKVIEFSAEQGYETLKALINTDEGTKSLGEMALVGKNSPIAKSKLLFYNTLFDENASCHFAFGQAYPTTINGGGDMTAEELAAHNANDSVEHVDFMVGTEDLKITGVTKDGKEVVVFIDGEWAF